MTEAEVVSQMRAHLESQFPKECPNCKRSYATLREYLKNTEIAGSAMPYDALLDDWNPLRPLGTVAYANCACGTTLALTSDGLPILQLWKLLNWARVELKSRGMTPEELLNYLRDEICKQVLA